MYRTIALLMVALALTGCAAIEQAQREQAMAQAQAQRASDDAQCQNYGAAPGSPMYVQCRMQLDGQRQQSADATRQMVLQYYLMHR